MGFKQPRVPEYRSSEGVERNIRTLILFLKDFCQESWMASRKAQNGLAGICYPVTSVNGKKGDVALAADDVGALKSGATAANASKLGGKTWAALMLEIYPAGAVYISVESTSPASLFGGTWERIKDRFLLAAGSSHAAGTTGGEATVTLTESEIPAHNHRLNVVSPHTSDGSKTTSYVQYGYDGEGNTFYTNANAMEKTGGGGSHNNMPPYLAVYMWKRVS